MAVKKAVDPAVSMAKAIMESLARRRSEGAGYPASLREVARNFASDISEADLRAALVKIFYSLPTVELGPLTASKPKYSMTRSHFIAKHHVVSRQRVAMQRLRY